MALTLFAAPFVDFLRASINRNLSSYKGDTPFAPSQSFAAQKEIVTPIDADLHVEFVLSDEIVGNGDAQNAAVVHRALSSLTPAQATDERLWARLAHVEFWQYMRARWPVERFDDADKAARFVLSRYFVPQSQSRALLRHGVARLWWAAHLTIDKHRDNPYALTEILLSRLDIAQQILERSIGRSRTILVAFLEFLAINRDRLLVSGGQSRAEIRALAKALNLSGGVSMLDALTEIEIIELLNRELEGLPQDCRDDTDAKDAEVEF